MGMILGIDTSNYKTSVALLRDDGEILCNLGKLLEVKYGERGLRQSDALFQHIKNLPELLQEAFRIASIHGEPLQCIGVSSKPRPVCGSYMPVFQAGILSGESISSANHIPIYYFSHQEGHIAAAASTTELAHSNRYAAFHFSGGTTEVLLVDKTVAGFHIEKIGGTQDISFGQVLDRVGVSYGYSFPAGSYLDDAAVLDRKPDKSILPKIKRKDGFFNLSGIETKAQRLYENVPVEKMADILFYRFSEIIQSVMDYVSEEYKIEDFLFAGGVSSSHTLRTILERKQNSYRIHFSEPALSGDNAVGAAILGGEAFGAETHYSITSK